MSRFDYVKYDEPTAAVQAGFKEAFSNLAKAIEGLPHSRPGMLALTKLEESYMWIGKALRDDQLMRNRETKLMEERKDG